MSLIYVHRRIDNNEVFYVGIGTTEKRANTKNNRNTFWHNVVKKYGFKVEITHKDIVREEACSIERYLIDFWREHSKVKLCNMTNGGDGTDAETSALMNAIRWSNPEEHIKLSNKNKERFKSNIEKEKVANANKKRFSNPEERDKVSETNKIRFSNQSARDNNAKKMKAFYSDEENLKKASERMSNYWKNLSEEKRSAHIKNISKSKIKSKNEK